MASTTIANTLTPRRLSLMPLSAGRSTHVNASSAAASQQNGSSTMHNMDGRNSDTPDLSVHFDEDVNKLTIRPNRVVRGCVKLKTNKALYASQIRVKFKAVEVACIKVKETKTEDRVEKLSTTYFETETKVFGNQSNAYFVNGWQVIEPGEHEFKFALKFPNVNFPPSVENPTGFSVRYLWTAYLDGAANHPGARSPEVNTTYRPLLCAPEATPWVFQDTLYKDKKAPLATIKVKLPAQVFIPEQTTQLNIEINVIPSDMSVGSLGYKVRKCYEGKLQLERGIAHKVFKRDVHQKMINIKDHMCRSGTCSNLHIPDLEIQLPSRLLSPCFVSNHIRVYYYLIFMIQFDHNNLLKSAQHTQVHIPIGIANVPHEHLARVPGLTSIRYYKDSRESPIFFDPTLEEPPSHLYPISPPLSACDDFFISSNLGSIPPPLPPPPAFSLSSPSHVLNPEEEALFQRTPSSENDMAAAVPVDQDVSSPPAITRTEPLPPPDYFSLNDVPQFVPKERIEKTRYSTRLVKPNMLMELGEPITIDPYSDDEW